jgi:hypothetical protein
MMMDSEKDEGVSDIKVCALVVCFLAARPAPCARVKRLGQLIDDLHQLQPQPHLLDRMRANQGTKYGDSHLQPRFRMSKKLNTIIYKPPTLMSPSKDILAQIWGIISLFT